MHDNNNFYVIVHGFKAGTEGAEGIKPYVHVTTHKESHDRHVRELQDDIDNGGAGEIIWHGETDNILFKDVWMMPFDK